MVRNSGKTVSSARISVTALIAAVMISGVVFVIWNWKRVIPPEPVMLKSVELNADDRIMILAPHPDDEVLGCAGIIQNAVAMGIQIKVVFFTYGDLNEWSFIVYRKHPVLTPSGALNMGKVRHDEAVKACLYLGLNPDDLIFLGYPDGGGMNIFTSHWAGSIKYRALLTRSQMVPYSDAYRTGAAYKGEEILSDMKAILNDFKPTKIFVSHPADAHPDHRALYLFTRVALWDLKLFPEPELLPYMVHSVRWPSPRGFYPEWPLPPPKGEYLAVDWEMFSLTPEQVERKYEAIKLHRTQFQGNRRYLVSFIRTNELFGVFPQVVLSASPILTNLFDRSIAPTIDEPEEMQVPELEEYVSFEERTVRIDNGKFEITIGLSKPLGTDTSVSVYVFGYKDDIDFALMPKIHIKFGKSQYSVYDQNRKIAKDSVEFIRSRDEITIKIPLHLLDNPDKILTGARSYLGNVPFHWLSWRELEIVKQTSILLEPQ